MKLRLRVIPTVLFFGLVLIWAAVAIAQQQAPPTPQFDFLGFIQEATLDTAGLVCTPGNDPATGLPSDRLRGGTITVNGIKMIVPCNTLLQLPAATMTWGDLFDQAQSTPVGSYIGSPGAPVPANPNVIPGQTGFALADAGLPFPSFEVRVQGNVVNGQYIVGLIVPVTQQGLNRSSGIITCINYADGSFRVGGTAGDCSTGALVQINDAADAGALPDGRLNGRWGLRHSPDPRFSGDFENSTVTASTGIPVCIPRFDPASGVDDTECPGKNRPGGAKIFTMPTPAQADANPSLPDPRKQVPMLVGDQVNYAGTLYKIDPLGPDTPANMYISAHTVEDVLGIFTTPGVPPAYLRVEDLLIGTGGAAVGGILQEASTRLTVVGFTTDPTRFVDIYAQDVNPCTGQQTLRLLATTDPATQAVVGRFVHRVLGGDFMPPTRNYVVKSRTQATDPLTGKEVQLIAANGFVTGQFLLPNFEFIFPENHRLGDPIIPFNFQDLPFLALGSGPVDGIGSTSPILGQLNPWPGSSTPAQVNCSAFGATPVVNAGPTIAVGINSQVQLIGSVTWDTNSDPLQRTTGWTQSAGSPVTINNPTSLTTANFISPATPQTLTFTLTATDNTFGVPLVGTATVNITVLQASDIVQITAATWAPQNGKRGPFGKLNVTATTSSSTALLSLSEIGADASVSNWGTGSNSPNALTTFNWVEIKGAPQPARLTVTSTNGGSATAICGQPDAKGRVTCQ